MSDHATFTVRPLSRPARTDLKDALRVNLSASSLLSLKLCAGNTCCLSDDSGLLGSAVAWQAVEKLQDTVVQVSKTLQVAYGLKLGDKIAISKHKEQISNASVVHLRQVFSGDDGPAEHKQKAIVDRDFPHWEWLLHDPLSKAEILSGGMIFEQVSARGEKHDFETWKVKSPSADGAPRIYRYGPETKVVLTSDRNCEANGELSDLFAPKIEFTGVGGYVSQLDQIQRVISRRYDPKFRAIVSQSNYTHSPGLLIHGPKGVGKSVIIARISAAFEHILTCSATIAGTSSVENSIKEAFEEARNRGNRCLIIIEDLDLSSTRSSREDSLGPKVLSTLTKAFASSLNTGTLVLAEARHPNNIPDALRSHTRFGNEIEIPVPLPADRLSILRSIRGPATEPSDPFLEELASKTHGYVGADLLALYSRVIESAATRYLAQATPSRFLAPPLPSTISIDSTDLVHALSQTTPSAMRSITLSPPTTPWTSIGGLSSLKQHLQRTVSRPLLHPSLMKSLNLRTHRNLLLYGPPGCSKTLLVKALATESSLNFLAVKGAELLSMWVGESERAVRELFQRARRVRPSIVFFDEFDALAGTRGSSSSSSSGGGGGGSNGVNILTTLLNELDGFEALSDVLIVAATNRPEMLDPALLRPGRFDHLVYVGLPDELAREGILRLWLGKSRVEKGWEEHVGGVDGWAKGLEGCSGAEIVGVCEEAGGLAMDELEGEDDWGGEGKGEEEIMIRKGHVDRAVEGVRRGVSREMVRGYEEWGNLR